VQTRFGFAARTFDVLENTGDRDHLERFREIALNKAKADAGELLMSLPNGAQAALLVDGNDKRVEIANTAVAQVRGSIDSIVDVRTNRSCIVCHGPVGGFIPFREGLGKTVEGGLQVKTVGGDKDDERRVRDFFTRWQARVEDWQKPYLRYAAETTASGGEKAWPPTEIVKQFQGAIKEYDAPVSLDTAALELGVSKRKLQALLIGMKDGKQSVRYESVKTRVNQLAVEQSIPRRAWEVDVCREVSFIIDAHRDADEAIKNMVSPELIRDAIEKSQKRAK
jgi:hypothetical protein